MLRSEPSSASRWSTEVYANWATRSFGKEAAVPFMLMKTSPCCLILLRKFWKFGRDIRTYRKVYVVNRLGHNRFNRNIKLNECSVWYFGINCNSFVLYLSLSLLPASLLSADALYIIMSSAYGFVFNSSIQIWTYLSARYKANIIPNNYG